MRRFVAGLIVIAILGGAGYYAYSKNWGPTDWVRRVLGVSGDSKISSSVKTALSLSKRLAPFNITAQTEEGVVTLSGQVPSEDLKSLAGDITRDVPGAREVKNNIVVDRGAQPSGEEVRVNDLEIKTAILEGLAHSPELGGKGIDVKVENRSVTLSGAVDTTAQRNGAEQLAHAVDGVNSVSNDLTVRNPQAPSEPASANPTDPNLELAKNVKFNLYETGAFDTLTLDVHAQDGNVTLTGSVRTRAEQVLATFVAQGVPGVKKVNNQLQLIQSPRR